jgi:hypothetical protein
MTWIPGLGDPRGASEPFRSAQCPSGSWPSICEITRLAIRPDNPRANLNAAAWPVQIPSYLGKNLRKQTEPRLPDDYSQRERIANVSSGDYRIVGQRVMEIPSHQVSALAAASTPVVA